MLILIDVPLYISVMHPMPEHPTTVSVKYLFVEANIA